MRRELLLKFDDLRKHNLQARDFFEIVESREFDGYFDLIIGNPPFDSKLRTTAAIAVEKLNAKKRPKLPDGQVALLFLEQSFRLSRTKGKICLIQAAGSLLYNGNAQDFRQYLFDSFNITSVFDFTALEGSLFKAEVAAAAVLAVNDDPVSAGSVLHITFRRTRAIKEKLLFELDPYDFHWISHKSIKNRPYAWKINLLGGGRLHRLVDRLVDDTPTLGDYLKQRRKYDEWQFGEGFNEGFGKLNAQPNVIELAAIPPEELRDKFKLKTIPKLAPWITGRQNVDPKALTSNGLKSEFITECKKLFFERPHEKTQKIFMPPHALIREVIDGRNIPAIFSDDERVFSKQIIGIHAPRRDEDKLRTLVLRLNTSGAFGFLAIVLSGRVLVSRATSILKEDIFSLPYNGDGQETSLNSFENALVDDVFENLVDFRLKGEKSRVLDKTQEKDLSQFGEMYCNVLNPVYEHFRPLQPIFFDSFVCYPFCFGEVPEIAIPHEDQITPYLEQLLHKQIGGRLFVNRVLRMYEGNVIFMVKPNQNRYWLRSIALRDADETLLDLLQQGY